MLTQNPQPETETEAEQYPVEPRYHPIHKIPRHIYDFLASSKFAMFLLVTILCCCIAGVTIYRGDRAWQMIFGTFWFNGILLLLIINVACCFFGRIWGRKVTVVSFGMILFHLSFVAMFAGVIYNSLHFFDATIRLTEGETLPNNDPTSYDEAKRGMFFNFSKLKGETQLHKVLPGYKVDGEEKRYAFDVAVGDEAGQNREIIYTAKKLDYNGIRYFRDKEGYSVLVVLYDRQGKELYGAHIPLQSLRQSDSSIVYSTGTKDNAGTLPFPQGETKPVYDLQVSFQPSQLNDRSGTVTFEVRPYAGSDGKKEVKPSAFGAAAVGQKFDAGGNFLEVKEIRYWVGMSVRYDPGTPLVLTSLWVALAGMVITTAGRIMRSRRRG